MRNDSDLRRLRAGVIVLAILFLSLHWSIREDPCARAPALEIVVVSDMASPADVHLTVSDAAGRTVFEGDFHLLPGTQGPTGPIEVAPGPYTASATVGGDGAGMQTLEVGPCGARALVEVAPGQVTIVRSEGP